MRSRPSWISMRRSSSRSSATPSSLMGSFGTTCTIGSEPCGAASWRACLPRHAISARTSSRRTVGPGLQDGVRGLPPGNARGFKRSHRGAKPCRGQFPCDTLDKGRGVDTIDPSVARAVSQPLSEHAESSRRPSVGTKLYVGNLNYNTTEQSLREAFGANGREVASVSIIMDRETGRSRGFAFVEMSTSGFAQQGLHELRGHELDGRMLRINEAREREARGPGGGG